MKGEGYSNTNYQLLPISNLKPFHSLDVPLLAGRALGDSCLP